MSDVFLQVLWEAVYSLSTVSQWQYNPQFKYYKFRKYWNVQLIIPRRYADSLIPEYCLMSLMACVMLFSSCRNCKCFNYFNHFNYFSQLLKEQQNVIKENIMATVKNDTTLREKKGLLKQSLMLLSSLHITEICMLITWFIFLCLHYYILPLISWCNWSASSHPHFWFSSFMAP